MDAARVPSSPSGLSLPLLGPGSRTSSSSSITSAGSPPKLNDAQRELVADFNGDELKRKTLTCNFKMVLGITLGVLVGLAVLAVVLGGMVASHGALGAVLGIVALKLTAGTSAAGSAIAGGAGGAILGKIISAVAVGVVFLGGGKIAGDLFRKGEVQQMDKLLMQSSDGIRVLEKECEHVVSEKELQDHIEDRQSMVLSSQSGRNFVQAKRDSGLHYEGVGGVLKNPIKAFGHFWLNIPTTSLKSFFDRKQYDSFNTYLELEEDLKKKSAGGNSQALVRLNEMRVIQVDRLLARSGAMGAAYSVAPELQIYDRNIAKLEILKYKFPEKSEKIERQIEIENEKKALLIAKRLEGTPAFGNIFSKSEESLVKSLLTIKHDVMSIDGQSEEHKGQIFEAVTILLRTNPKATIGDVNILVKGLSDTLRQMCDQTSEPKPHWQTRASVNMHAKKFAESTLKSRPDAVEVTLEFSEEKAPMTSQVGGRYALRALDIAISCIHMLPIPGSSGLAALATAAAVVKEKRGG